MCSCSRCYDFKVNGLFVQVKIKLLIIIVITILPDGWGLFKRLKTVFPQYPIENIFNLYQHFPYDFIPSCYYIIFMAELTELNLLYG